MKYKYVRKTFELNSTIEIPDNAIAIQNNGYSFGTQQVETECLGIPITKPEICGLVIEFEWLEPIESIKKQITPHNIHECDKLKCEDECTFYSSNTTCKVRKFFQVEWKLNHNETGVV